MAVTAVAAAQYWAVPSVQSARVGSRGAALQASGRRKEMHSTDGAVEVRRARRRLREAADDERLVGEARPRDRLRDRLWRGGSRPSISSTHGPHPLYIQDSLDTDSSHMKRVCGGGHGHGQRRPGRADATLKSHRTTSASTGGATSMSNAHSFQIGHAGCRGCQRSIPTESTYR